MKKKQKLSGAQVVGTSFAVSVSDVALNLIVALITGSAVMLAQALQGLSDVTTAAFLYIGVKRSQNKSDPDHPFGYGRELFFWALLAATFMLIGTGGLSLYFGWQQIIDPEPVEYIGLAIAMLCFGFVTNAYALSRSVKRLSQRGGLWPKLRSFYESGMIETKTTLLVDSIGTGATLFGLLALVTYTFTGQAQLDGFGALAVGIAMIAGSVIIMRDIRGLIIGRTVPPETSDLIIRTALSVQGVKTVLDMRAMYIGSTKLLIILEVHLVDDLTTDEIENIMDTVKVLIHEKVPEAHRVQVEVETPEYELIT